MGRGRPRSRGPGLGKRAIGGLHNFGLRTLKASAGFFGLGDHDFLQNNFLGFGQRTDAGVFINPGKSMEISAYYASIRNISEDIGKLPLNLFRALGEDKGSIKAVNHPLWKLITLEPNPNMGKMVFWELILEWALAWRGGYAEIQRDARGRPVQLNPIHPTNVKIKKDENGNIFYEIRSGFSSQVTKLAPFNVIHIRGLGDAVDGFSTTQLASETLGLASAQQTTAATFFGNNAMVSGILEHPETIDQEAAKAMREGWQEIHGGPRNSNKIAVLWEGVQFRPLSVPFRDAELIASRKFSVEEIARWFRMPPHKIQHLEKSAFSNIERQSLEYVGDTLDPWLQRIKEEIDRKLLDGEGPMFVEHDLRAMLRGDSKQRAEYYTKLFHLGSLTPNDIRKFENLNPFPGGDKHYVMVNVMPIDEPLEDDDDDNGALKVTRDMVGKLEPVVRGQVARLFAKEAKALERAAQKPGGEMVKSLRKFYVAFHDDMTNAFDPICKSFGSDNMKAYKTAIGAWAEEACDYDDDPISPDNSSHAKERAKLIITDGYIDKATTYICAMFKNISDELEKNPTETSLIAEK